ncbi:MAG: hypothetical protein AB1489_24780 [Acidobacteriota bacterium]
MEAAKELTDIGSFLVMGAEFVENDWHKGEIIVERHGLLHPKYIFMHKSKEIAVLTWRRTRTGIYEAKGLRLDLQVGTLAKTIYAKDEMSRLSRLIVRSPLNPRKAKMIIQLADSDSFLVRQHCKGPHGDSFSLHVTKNHYVSDLVTFEFGRRKKHQRAIARIYVPAIMRWEAHHFHHLLALVMARIAFVQEHDLYRGHSNRFLRERTTIGKRQWQYI